jgi:hypothetical protein
MVLAKPAPPRRTPAADEHTLAAASTQFRRAPVGRAAGGSRAIDSAAESRARVDGTRAYPRHARSLNARALRQRALLLTLAAGIVAVASTIAVPKIVHGRPDPAEPVLREASTARAEAAAWTRRWISPSAIVACDPVMCGILLRAGVPVGELMQLTAVATGAVGASVVIVTPALRSQLRRLAPVYAPDVLASFGRGSARVEIRVVAPDGSAAYQQQLKADWQTRKANGELLRQNSEIAVSGLAARQLTDGEVDSRLLIILPALVHFCGPIRILRFAGAGPDRSPGMPLLAAVLAPVVPRAEVLAAGRPAGSLARAAAAADERSAMARAGDAIAAFLGAQWTSIRASYSRHTEADGQVIVQLNVSAPPQFNAFSGNPVMTTPINPGPK